MPWTLLSKQFSIPKPRALLLGGREDDSLDSAAPRLRLLFGTCRRGEGGLILVWMVAEVVVLVLAELLLSLFLFLVVLLVVVGY